MGKLLIYSLSGTAVLCGLLLGAYEVQQVTMPPLMFTLVVTLFYVSLGIAVSLVIFASIRTLQGWLRSLQFVANEWTCQYNHKTQELRINGIVDKYSSAFSKMRASVIVGGKVHNLKITSNKETRILSRYAIELVGQDIFIDSQYINIKAEIVLTNWRRKTFKHQLKVIPVGG